jgi:hypothetical protein
MGTHSYPYGCLQNCPSFCRLRGPGSTTWVCRKVKKFGAKRARGNVTRRHHLQHLNHPLTLITRTYPQIVSHPSSGNRLSCELATSGISTFLESHPLEKRVGDLARTQQTFLIPLNGTVDQKVPQACDDPEVCSHFNQPITTYSRIEVFEMVEKHSGIELAIF